MVLTCLAPSQGAIELACRQGGVARSCEPDSPGTFSAQQIDDQREKLAGDSLTSIAVIDREPKYFSGDGVPYAVAHHSALVCAFPEFYPPTQYIGGERLIFPSGGAELPNIGLSQFSWAKLQVHRRARVHSLCHRSTGRGARLGLRCGSDEIEQHEVKMPLPRRTRAGHGEGNAIADCIVCRSEHVGYGNACTIPIHDVGRILVAIEVRRQNLIDCRRIVLERNVRAFSIRAVSFLRCR